MPLRDSARAHTILSAIGAGFVALATVLLGLFILTLAIGPWYCPREPPCGSGPGIYGPACIIPACNAYPWWIVFLVLGTALAAVGSLLIIHGPSALRRSPIYPGIV